MAHSDMSSDIGWHHDPDELVRQMQHGDMAFRRPLGISGYDDPHELRRGGQGVVYSAIQRSTKRRVAIKVLFEDAIARETGRRRFEREIDLVSSLKHPGITRVFDSGVTPDDRLYFIMEYVDGASLDELLDDARDRSHPQADNTVSQDLRLPSTLVGQLQMFADICDAVAYAHQHGVIHRDLKPNNIRLDSSGQPHVLDFGIARSLTTDDGRDVSMTGHFLGTLAYASPQQLCGDRSQVDVRSDVYALGVILYEMLTGRMPYPVTGGIGDVTRSITEIQPSTPRINDEVDTIVLKALSKDPDRRYQSVQALRQDVLHYLDGRPIEAKRDSAWYMFKKTVCRHKLISLSVVTVLLVITGSSIALGVMYDRAKTQADKVKNINLFLEDTLFSAEPHIEGRELTVRNMLDESLYWLDNTLADQPEVRASLRTTIGNCYRQLGILDIATGQLELALETRLALFGREHVDVARNLSALGLVHKKRGDFSQSEQLLRESLAIRRRLLGDDHFDVASNLTNLGELMKDGGAFDEAEALLRESLEIRKTIFESGSQQAGPASKLASASPAVAFGQFSLAELYRAKGDPELAERHYRDCLSARRAILTANHPDLLRSMIALGSLLVELDRPDEAMPLLRDSFNVLEAERGLTHPMTVEVLHHLVELHEAANEFDQATAFREMLPKSLDARSSD